MEAVEGSAAHRHRHRAGLVVAGGHHQRAKARVFYNLFPPLTAGLGWAGSIQKLTFRLYSVYSKRKRQAPIRLHCSIFVSFFSFVKKNK
jgi:hypothetical protein